ncbi:hypothetical protein C8F04DRAFT_1251092 [Mycena alexandri]|uniref:RED-like N-terminal domain-containing protein n=1 Tax=Mycena alexandri TaxID=1745969 RepID=A0AAD6TCH2_9AGAR|nr:hypothetical protein C8F04DRAFT_1251092 [Mycena alexandri]
MDQDSFRRLLESGSGSGSGGSKSKQSQRSRGSLLVAGGSNAASARKTLDASEPAFKPRKVKKAEGKYRDRAAERRVGEGNDYAQVEAVLEDFEKRLGDNTAATDEQRSYLGGDSEHSILVKGLDIALLEQNKAKASLSTVDDDSLEQAFIAAAAPAKKRTREDMIRELKEKRGVKSAATVPTEKAQEDARALEAAKKQGKFKPIGFKPIGGTATEEKTKKKKVKAEGGVDGERKKKKRKIDAPAEEKSGQVDVSMSPPPAPSTSKDSSLKPPPPEDVDMQDDFDIFAGAEEYAGIDLGEDDDDEEGEVEDGVVARKPETTESELEEGEHAPRKWFEEDEPDPPPAASKLPLPPGPSKISSRPMAEDDGDEDEGELEQAPMRLVPLASSALPSIKELLAADKAANSSEKWRKRKDKKGGKADEDRDDGDVDEGGDAGGGGAKGKGKEKQKQKMSAEVKAERDYKRLKNYTDKKAAT